MKGKSREDNVLRILALEDNDRDADRMERALKKGRFLFQLRRVSTRDDFFRELTDFCPELIITEEILPPHDCLTILNEVRQKGIDVPYMFLTRTLDKKIADEMLKRGATECILKKHLPRLVPAIIRAIPERRERFVRRETDKSLQVSEEKFKGIAASAQDAIFMVDGKENISYWNEAAERIFGYNAQEIMGKKLRLLFASAEHADAYRKEIRHFDNSSDDAPARQLLTFTAAKMDGTEFLAELTIAALELQGDWHAVSIVRDVTKRTQVEDQLRRSERNLVRAQEIAHIGSWRWDIVNDKIIWAHGSNEAYRIFGLVDRQSGVTFETFLHAVHIDDRAFVKTTIDNALGGGSSYDIDHRIVLPDASVRFVHEQAEVVRDDSGKAVGMEGTVHDITAQKKSEKMLQRQLKNMTALNDIAMSISSSLDVRVTLNVLLEKLTSLLKVDAADVLLLDQDSFFLNYAAGRGFRAPEVVQSTHVRLGKGYAGQAAYERRALIIADLSETVTKALKGESFKSYIAMPLIAQGKVKGVLEIFQRKPLDATSEWMNFLELLAGQAAIAINNAEMFDRLQRFTTELTLSYDATLEGWGRALEFRDEDTMGHTERVTERSLALARRLGMADLELVQVRRGALLHDIGKIGIPDSILLKPSSLTTEEQTRMKLHTVYARDLLSGIPFLRQAIDIPYCHHEKWNGEGYPQGLKGEDIPFNARVFSVIDVADALISERPYRPAWTVAKTYEYIASLRGVHFDPIVVDTFLDMKWAH